MKKLRITVNNKVYDVTVEVLGGDEPTAAAAAGDGLPAPPVHGAMPRIPAPTPLPAPPPVAPGAHDPNQILSPIAGTVQKVFVAVGTHLEAKTPVILLDAMKMDTYIYAPHSGQVAEVCVAAGEAVQVGDPLIRYQAAS
jgi:glutaconyl-CoA/methylmalonyl-CoA decarboxylase subunit gamma